MDNNFRVLGGCTLTKPLIEYALRRGHPMTKEASSAPKTATRPLFSTATQENLSLLVVLNQSLHMNHLIFAHCLTDPLPSG